MAQPVVPHVMFLGQPFDWDYKEKAVTMTPMELRAYHDLALAGWKPYRASDTTDYQMRRIMDLLPGATVLEVGCGNASMAVPMAQTGRHVTGCAFSARTIEAPPERHAGAPVSFQTAATEEVPWEASAFHTVVCSHTLEHVLNPFQCAREIKRVAARRLIVVVLCQKYKRYTIDTHLHFFPTEPRLRWLLGLPDAQLERVDGGWGLFWHV